MSLIQPTLNERLVITLLATVWEQRTTAFKENTGTREWRDMIEIMAACQAWTNMPMGTKVDTADHLTDNKVIGAWVSTLAEPHMRAIRDLELREGADPVRRAPAKLKPARLKEPRTGSIAKAGGNKTE